MVSRNTSTQKESEEMIPEKGFRRALGTTLLNLKVNSANETVKRRSGLCIVEESPVMYNIIEEFPVMYNIIEEFPVMYNILEESPVMYNILEESPVLYKYKIQKCACTV